jgi:AcrR family transcriptional regulator
MKNKELQEKRMKEYFIQATKEILKSEGIQSLSVRNIATQAGYSYATMYNYFRDINELIFLCIQDFQNECRDYVESKVKKKSDGIETLKESVNAYLNYFIEYSGIFDLFYLTKMGDFGHKKTTLDLIGGSLEDACRKSFDVCRKKNILSAEQEEKIKSGLSYSVIGLLLLYINRMTPESYQDFMNNAQKQLDFVINSVVEKS